MKRILAVDDDRAAREFIRLLLEQEGYEAVTAADGVEALVALEHGAFDLIVSDLDMPEMGGAELLSHVAQRWPEIPVVILTAASQVSEIVEIVQRGAVDYVVKPATPAAVSGAIARALALDRETAPRESALAAIVGSSRAMVEVRHRVTLAARSNVPVLVTGQTGTGKEVVARAIHDTSSVASGPFVPHNCAASPRELFESLFFGHRKGSFTGADQDHLGLLREAHGGTLFLDELETLDPMFQAKLLRVLDDGEVRPVGSEQSSQVAVRFVAATNREPEAMLADGSLREDLYFRLRGFEIVLPPLAERRQDIPALVEHFLAGAPGPTAEAMSALEGAPWPGNVRELRNVIASAVAIASGRAIELEHLPRLSAPAVMAAQPTASGSVFGEGSTSLKDVERRAILEALERCEGNRSRAARMLEIDRSTLRRKLHEFGIESKR